MLLGGDFVGDGNFAEIEAAIDDDTGGNQDNDADN